MEHRFGKWNDHFSLRELLRWYALPEYIVLELQDYVYDPAHADPLPPDKFRNLMRGVERFTNDSVGGDLLPAHNPQLHFDETRNSALELFDAQYGARAQTELLFVRQILEAAAYAHDCGHRGCTLRIDHPKSKFGRSMPLPLPELGTEVTVEFVSALLLDQFLTEQDEVEVSLAARLFAMSIILDSTYGHKAAKERGLDFVPFPRPTNVAGGIIRAADSKPKPNFKENTDYGARVIFGEVPATGFPAAPDPMSLIASQQGYLRYCLGEQDALDRIVGKELCKKLRAITLGHLSQFDRIIAGDDPAGLKFIEDLVSEWTM